MTFADRVIEFNKDLTVTGKLPKGVEVMNPFQDPSIYLLTEQFYRKYYSDNQQRYLIVGINPGRRGGGLTGIPFTDPIKLKDICGINNDLERRAELSADFIYLMIKAYGGPEKFYQSFYFNSVCPLGFTRDGKNLNYYDLKDLQKAVLDFIVKTMQQQINLGVYTYKVFCMGEGANFKFLSKLNEEYQFFKEIVPLPHPRFIMQYKRKKVDEYISRYLKALQG